MGFNLAHLNNKVDQQNQHQKDKEIRQSIDYQFDHHPNIVIEWETIRLNPFGV